MIGSSLGTRVLLTTGLHAGAVDQAVPELRGGDAGDGAPEGPAAPAARGPAVGPFPSFGAGLSEVQVLDHDRAGSVSPGGGDEAADRRPQPTVAGGGAQPGQVKGGRWPGCRGRR